MKESSLCTPYGEVLTLLKQMAFDAAHPLEKVKAVRELCESRLQAEASYVAWDIEAVKHDLRDAFAKGVPSDDELDEILTPPPRSALSEIEPQNLTLSRERDEALAQRDYWKRTAEAPPSAKNAIPDVLFDGVSVYEELRESERTYTSAQNVSAVLDAIVRLLRDNKVKA